MYAVQRNDAGRRWMVRERAEVGAQGSAAESAGSAAERVTGVSAETIRAATYNVPDQGTQEASASADSDELYLLGERCAETYMQAEALQYEAMVLLTEFESRDGWRDTGFGGTAEWLAWRVGIKLHTAKDRLRVALAPQDLPLTSAAMSSGQLSYSKARGMARSAEPESEEDLLALAQSTSAARFERECRTIKHLDRERELTAAQIQHRSRRVSVFVDDDGMYVVTGRLDPEAGALLMRTVEAANDALYKSDPDPEQTKPEQRRADAMGLVCERAMSAGFKPDGAISGAKAERYQVVLHVDEDTLSEDREPGRSELEDGARVSAETARRLSCDAAVVRMGHGGDGQIASVGHRHRTIPPSLRRALEARDRGCRFPGCGSRFTDAHHLKHWANGGEHALRNLLLLCSRHHRAVHEGRVRVVLNHQAVAVFYAPNGKVMMSTPPGMTLSPRRSLDEATRETLPWHRKGADRYSDSDLPVEILHRARESL